MKFNRKVYVVPEEKYLRMMEIAESRKRDERVRRDSVKSSEPDEDENLKKPVPSDEEKSPLSRTSVPEKDESLSSPGFLKEALSKLKSQKEKTSLKALFYALTSSLPDGESDEIFSKKPDELVDLLLHTQSDDFPTPEGHKDFYAALLRNGVPLRLVSNSELRRVLHYLKNKSSSKNPVRRSSPARRKKKIAKKKSWIKL